MHDVEGNNAKVDGAKAIAKVDGAKVVRKVVDDGFFLPFIINVEVVNAIADDAIIDAKV